MDLDFAAGKYRELISIFHPDKPQGNDDTFRKIQQEYEDFQAIKRNWAELCEFFRPKTLIRRQTKFIPVKVQEKPVVKPDLNSITQTFKEGRKFAKEIGKIFKQF